MYSWGQILRKPTGRLKPRVMTRSTDMVCYPSLRDLWSRSPHALLLSGILLLSALLSTSQAQITLDGSLGPQGPLTGPNYRIGPELGQIRGSNLFHSFGQFNVRSGERATFTGPNTIANIVGRVTGGEPSSINGRLRSEIVGANLFLLNPSGVMFGPNARLEVSGSFHVSTADYLRLADATIFSAHLGPANGLTVAPPEAFGFLGTNPAAITIRGSMLQVREGHALSVVGGDVQLEGGTLSAPSGRIQLLSLASPGEVGFSPLTLAPDLQLTSAPRFGRIALSQSAMVTVGTQGPHDAGAIAVRGGQVTLTGRSRLAATTASQSQGGTVDVQADQVTLAGGATISASTSGAGQGGTVTVTAREAMVIAGDESHLSVNATSGGDAGRIVVSAPTLRIDGGEIRAETTNERVGNGGTIEVQVGMLTITAGGRISASTSGAGRGGTVTVTAREAIVITGQDSMENPSRLSADTGSRGDAGRIVVSAPMVHLTEKGRITARANGAGQGGMIEVQVGTLTLTRGGRITARTIGGSGSAGSITITAREAILIAGRFSDRTADRSMVDSTTDDSPGDAGRIVISAPSVRLTDEGQIDARGLSDSQGRGGTIEIQVSQLTLTDGGLSTSAVWA
jgi:filamentous hemagglutinin family protein